MGAWAVCPVGREACGVPFVEEGWVEVGRRRGERPLLRPDWSGFEGGTTRGEAAILQTPRVLGRSCYHGKKVGNP